MAKSFMQQEIEKFEKRWDSKLLAMQDKVIALEVKVDRIKGGRKQGKAPITVTIGNDSIDLELESKFINAGIRIT